jgi:hypothetical protein
MKVLHPYKTAGKIIGFSLYFDFYVFGQQMRRHKDLN